MYRGWVIWGKHLNLIWEIFVPHISLNLFSGSPSLRSPTENSIASLVSAAAIVKAKSESEREGQPTTGIFCNNEFHETIVYAFG